MGSRFVRLSRPNQAMTHLFASDDASMESTQPGMIAKKNV